MVNSDHLDEPSSFFLPHSAVVRKNNVSIHVVLVMFSGLQVKGHFRVRLRGAEELSLPQTTGKCTFANTPERGRTPAPSQAVDAPSPLPAVTGATLESTQVHPQPPFQLKRTQVLPLYSVIDGRSLLIGEKPYLCTVPGCDKRFTEYSTLYQHHEVHIPFNPYSCNNCGKSYKVISSLDHHKRTAHNDAEVIEEEQEA